jgi:hypothetical protein
MTSKGAKRVQGIKGRKSEIAWCAPLDENFFVKQHDSWRWKYAETREQHIVQEVESLTTDKVKNLLERILSVVPFNQQNEDY